MVLSSGCAGGICAFQPDQRGQSSYPPYGSCWAAAYAARQDGATRRARAAEQGQEGGRTWNLLWAVSGASLGGGRGQRGQPGVLLMGRSRLGGRARKHDPRHAPHREIGSPPAKR